MDYEYTPEKITFEVCPNCGHELNVIDFRDNAHGSPRNFVERSCENCNFYKID